MVVTTMSGEIPAFLGITPFGPYCKLCDVSLSVQRGIAAHGKELHPKEEFKNSIVVRYVQRRMKVLRSLHANDLTQFLTDQPSSHRTCFCNVCFSAFSKPSNYNRHLEVPSNIMCVSGTGGKVPCFRTICGRFGPRQCNTTTTNSPTTPTTTLTIVTATSSVSMLSERTIHSLSNKSLSVEPDSKVPAPLLITQDEACKILKPFVRPDEDVNNLYQNYLPILAPGFDGRMKEYLTYSMPQPAEDTLLCNWLEAGREWFNNYADGHIANVSANVRSRLAEFEQRELDGTVVRGSTFVLRRGIPRLIYELEALLRFCFRYPSTIFDSFKTTEVRNASQSWMIESAIIPKILFTAVAEEPEHHGKLPVICLYCLSRGFKSRGETDLTMTECGWFASRISAVLHLLRAGVCGYLVTLRGSMSSNKLLTVQEMDIVGKIQNGRVTNVIAPYIKRLREAHDKKPKNKSNTVNSSGDITSDSFTFPFAVWSTLIPRIEQISTACFNEVFDGDKWKLFMVNPVRMVDWAQLDASVIAADQTLVRLCDFVVRSNVEPVIAKLQSVVQLCLYGMGAGALRHKEVLRLTVLSCQWHNSYLYFWSESVKKGSLKASSTLKLVEHRLSLTLSRIVLLARYAMVVSTDMAPTETLLSDFSGYSMLDLVQEIFEFDRRPQKLNIRHLFTSIGNVIMPEKGMRADDGCLVSNTMLTEKSGHTQMTGRQSYGTWLENSEEAMYDMYHRSLGEATLDPPTIDFIPLTDSVLKSSLRALLGRKATYRSGDQKRMIQVAANSIARHAFVGLPCGHGKSLSWLVPALASYLSGRHVGLRIVILPYKFLLGHVVQHALTLLGLLQKKLTVTFLDSSQISEDTLPAALDGDAVPSLLFLNLDSAATLLRFHLPRLQHLVERNILKRIYLDEFQQLLVEYGFRRSYQSLQDLGRVGVPVMCLSGSLPCSMAMPLMTYCGLNPTSGEDLIEIVRPTDPIGDGFSFIVHVVDNIAEAIIEYVLSSRVGGCHVLCSSKSLVETVTTRLSTHLKVLSITGDSAYQDQVTCARKWYSGEYDVLVSTVVALVGNENRLCKTIVVGGFLFNVSSLVQAIGRLRPEQRGPTTRVQVYHLAISCRDRHHATKLGDDQFTDLSESGCLKEGSKEQYFELFGPTGLQKILSLKSGCYLQQLSRCFGFSQSACGRCGLCMKIAFSSESVDDDDDDASPRGVLVDRDSSFVPLDLDSRDDTASVVFDVGVDSAIDDDMHAQAVPRDDFPPFLTDCVDPCYNSSNKAGPDVSRPNQHPVIATCHTGLVHQGQSVPTKPILSKISRPGEMNLNPYKRRRIERNGVVSSKLVSENASKSMKLLCKQAQWVFSELLYRCIACGKSVCNGECVNGCYRCGDRSHFTRHCCFDTKRLSRILGNKGVCFGCFDTRQHLMKDHDWKACPLKKRLKRLLFLDHDRKGIPFELYLRQLYSSEMSFVRMVASFSDKTTLGRIWIDRHRSLIKLACIQVEHDAVGAPLLPPDLINKSRDVSSDGRPETIRLTNLLNARILYQQLRKEKSSILRHRKFVFGAMYENMFPGYLVVDPVQSDYNLVVMLPSKKKSILKIRLVSPIDAVENSLLLSSIVELGRALAVSRQGNCRGVRVGDVGSMHAIGVKSGKTNASYKTSDIVLEKARPTCERMLGWLKANMNEVLEEMQLKDSERNVQYPPSLAGGPASRMVLSVNLGNSPHYDTGDSSVSVAVWAEEKPGQSTNWFFVLPNVSCMGSHGVAIKLMHGVVISWDGREIFHCTSRTDVGNDNRVYGCLWGSCNDK